MARKIDFENREMPYFEGLMLSHFAKYEKLIPLASMKCYLILGALLGNDLNFTLGIHTMKLF